MSPGARARRAGVAAFGRLTLTAGLVVALYYLVPVEPGLSGTALLWRVLATLLAGLCVTWLIVRQLSRQLADPAAAPLADLLTALVAGVAFFALVDYLTAITGPGQFADLHTRTDALYFALATLTTVGYGDVHAVGQTGRIVVSFQLVFNVVVLTTAASVLSRQVGDRMRARVPRRGSGDGNVGPAEPEQPSDDQRPRDCAQPDQRGGGDAGTGNFGDVGQR